MMREIEQKDKYKIDRQLEREREGEKGDIKRKKN